MKVKCPWCGAVGTDREPYASHGPDLTPPKDEGTYAFEVRGNYRSRPVRKCLSCGNGVRVTILPPRFRKVPPDLWADLQRLWKRYKAEQAEEMRNLPDRLGAIRESFSGGTEKER
jgi:hypothetical protein